MQDFEDIKVLFVAGFWTHRPRSNRGPKALWRDSRSDTHSVNAAVMSGENCPESGSRTRRTLA